MKNIAVLISGGGTNLQAIIDAIENKEINAQIRIVISNVKDAFGLERAKKHNIEQVYLPKSGLNHREYNLKILEILKDKNIDLIVLAGYLGIISEDIVYNFKNKIINIHPSLIPSFCGKGNYGMNVHNKVYESGVKITGATTHFVDENIDTGCIILQDVVKITKEDKPEDIARKVLKIEHLILIRTVKAFCDDKILIENNRAFILEDDNE